MFSGISRFTKVAAVIAAAPPVLLGMAVLLLVLGVPAVRNWFWRAEPVTISEAAALRDFARVRALVEDGTNPNARSHVRAGIFGDVVVEMTPREAAIRAGVSDVVERLLQESVPPVRVR